MDEILAKSYGQQQTFLVLSLLYDEASWGTMQFHQDHLFAQSLFKPADLIQNGRAEWIPQKDRLGNLCLLLARENIGKQDKSLEDWLLTREPEFLRRHLIPEDKTLWKFENFPKFLEEREKLIKKRLVSVLGGKDADADESFDVPKLEK